MMQLKKTGLIVIGIVMTLARLASAQAAQATVDNGSQNVASLLAAAISGPSEGSGHNPLLADDVVIRRFNRTERENLSQLRSRAAGRSVVAARVYSGTPTALATDLSTDFRDGVIPDALKRILIPPTTAQLQHANELAVNWINTTLAPSSTDVVGVIVLSAPESTGDSSASLAPPLFILFKAPSAAAGRPVAKLIVYGDPRQ